MTQPQTTLIRPATYNDLAAINAIYNFYVINTPITFDETPWTLAQRQEWFKQFVSPKLSPSSKQPPYSLWVAEISKQDTPEQETSKQVVGFAYTSAFRPKSAYHQSAEVTIYLKQDPQLQGKGIGTQLYQALITQAQAYFHRLYAIIALPNEASINLHKAFGFTEVGELNQVGYKLGQYHSVLLMEKALLKPSH